MLAGGSVGLEYMTGYFCSLKEKRERVEKKWGYGSTKKSPNLKGSHCFVSFMTMIIISL